MRCKCGDTQNSAKLMLDRIGRSEKAAVWLSEPLNGDVVDPGFGIRAAVTEPPISLELYVDGILAEARTPGPGTSTYQEFDFASTSDLRFGTHHLELVARYSAEEKRVTALIEVGGDDGGLLGGCSAGQGASSGKTMIISVLFAMLLMSPAHSSRCVAGGSSSRALVARCSR